MSWLAGCIALAAVAVLAVPILLLAFIGFSHLKFLLNFTDAHHTPTHQGPKSNEVVPNRVTAQIDGDFVIFLIGISLNSWKGLPTLMKTGRAMTAMHQELKVAPKEVGFLGVIDMRNPGLQVQYWRSHEHLFAYARKPKAEHFPAWMAFNKMVSQTRSAHIGIYHETYMVRAGQYDCIYYAMPPIGLMRFGDRVLPAAGHLKTAAGRAGVSKGDDHPEDAPLIGADGNVAPDLPASMPLGGKAA